MARKPTPKSTEPSPEPPNHEALARELACEPLLAEIIAISDDPDLDASDKRVRIDARKWAIAQLAEKRAEEQQAAQNTTAQNTTVMPEGLRVYFVKS